MQHTVWFPTLLSTLQVVSMEEAFTLTPQAALHIQAIDTYTDQFDRRRYTVQYMYI